METISFVLDWKKRELSHEYKEIEEPTSFSVKDTLEREGFPVKKLRIIYAEDSLAEQEMLAKAPFHPGT